MIAALPFMQASESGVTPSRFAAFTLAPARSSRSVDRQVGAVHRPMQRRRAVGLRGIHVRLLRQQRAHRRRVPRMAASATSLPRGAQAGDRQQQPQRAQLPTRRFIRIVIVSPNTT